MINREVYNIFSLISILSIIFLPKITIINLEGYQQGIRIEDILILVSITLYIFIFRNKKIIPKNNKFNYFLFYLFLIFSINLFSSIFFSELKFLYLIRIFEYICLIYIFFEFKIQKKKLISILIYFLLINFFFIILQKLKLVGSFTSFGYFDPSHEQSQRPMGLTGGSWEIGVLCGIIFLIFTGIKKNNKQLFFIFFLCFTICYLAEGRANIIALCICSLIYSLKKISNIKIISLPVFLLLIMFFSNFFLNSNLIERIFVLDYTIIKELILSVFSDKEVSYYYNIDNNAHLSFIYRVEHWKSILEKINSNKIFWIIGSGFDVVYTESLFIRVIMTSGIIGFVYVLMSILNVKLYIIAYYAITGFFLDLFISNKIFVLTLLLIYTYQNYKIKNDT
jgi:hypothetical protein